MSCLHSLPKGHWLAIARQAAACDVNASEDLLSRRHHSGKERRQSEQAQGCAHGNPGLLACYLRLPWKTVDAIYQLSKLSMR